MYLTKEVKAKMKKSFRLFKKKRHCKISWAN